MKFYMVQHGDAVPKDVDADRPLSEKGRAEVEQIAQFLGKCGVTVPRILHSDRTRSRQTAEVLAAVVGTDAAVEEGAELGPDDQPKGLAVKLGVELNDLMVVGHMPFVGKLVSFLITDSMHASVVDFQPGTVVCLRRDAQGLWAILWMLSPALLSTEEA